MNSIDIKEIRKVGIIAFVFFGCLCILGFWTKKPLPTYLFGLLSILGLGFILIPSFLKPVYTGWLKMTQLLSRFITTFILVLVYYLVITPSAIIKRIFGNRPLPAKPDKKILSYWVNPTEPAQPKERFLKRF